MIVRLLFVLLAMLPVMCFGAVVGQTEQSDNEALLQQIEQADFESLFDISLEHNVDWEVGTPTKSSKKATRSPASITVISHEQIKMYGYNSVAEVLAHISGFSRTNDLVQSHFGIRGIHPGSRAGNRNFKVMLDGQSVNFRANSQNFIDRMLIPISMVERIEVIKGPVSALYGADAFLGVVNVVSKSSEEFIRKGQQLKLQWLGGRHGSDGYFVEVSGGEKILGWDTRVGFSTGQEALDGLSLPLTSPDYGQFADGSGGRHLASRDSDSQPLSFYLASRYQNEKQQQWKVALHYQQLSSDNPFADLNALRDSGYSRTSLYNSFAAIEHHRAFTPQWTGHFKLSYKDGAPLGSDRVELGSQQFYYERDIAYHGYDVSVELDYHSEDFGDWLFGADFSNDEHQLETFTRIEKADRSATPLSEPMARSLDNQGLVMQWQSLWFDSIETIMGVRFDNNDVFDNRTSYRLGAVYPLQDNHSIKLLAGSSFQAPSMELLYRQSVQRGDVSGNPDLKPQEANTVELVATGTLGLNMRYNATFYYSEVEDLVVYRDDQNNLTAINGASAQTKGFELDIGYDSDNLNAYFNVGWQQTRMSESSLFVLENRVNGELFPKYTVSTGVSYRWDNGLRVSLDNCFNDERPASSSNVLAAETFYEIDAFLDTTLTVQSGLKWLGLNRTHLQFQIEDLWDNSYVQPGFGGIDIPTKGRRYSLTVSQRF